MALDKMATDWATAELAMLHYRDTGTFVIKLDEAVLQQLDDHIGESAAIIILWLQFWQPKSLLGCLSKVAHKQRLYVARYL